MRGGKRPKSGRKPGPETKTISFRLKLDQIEPVRELVMKYLKETKKINYGHK